MTRVHVTGTGPAILLISGLTRPLEAWDHLAAHLPGRTVITFDAPGIGSYPRRLSIPALADLTANVLDTAGVDTADILGFSHGGAVAQQLAHTHPARVRSLILAGTSCGVGSTLGDPAALLALRHPGTDPLAVLWRTWAFTRWSSIGFLGSLRVPTLVVVGAADAVCPPANSRALASRIPGAVLRVLPADHDLQAEAAALHLGAAVNRFLSSNQEEMTA